MSRRSRLASFGRQPLDQVCTVIIVYSFACTGYCCNTLPLCRTCSWAWLRPACSLALCQPRCFTLTSCPSPPPLCNSGLLCKALVCCYTCCCLAPLPWHLLHKLPAVGDLPGCFVTNMKGRLWGYRRAQCRCAASYG